MKVVFCSNYLNHHQLHFCETMLKEVDEFIFIAEKPMEKFRIDMGWEDMNSKEFVLRAYESENSFKEAVKLCNEADIVIAGDSSEKFIEQRSKDNKVIFYGDERLLKDDNPYWHLRHWFHFFRDFKHRKQLKMSNAYLLCYGAYVKHDYKICYGFRNPGFRFGYFPYIKRISKEVLFAQKSSDIIKVLIVSRFIEWKRIDLAVKAFVKVSKLIPNLQLELIGNTEEDLKYTDRIKKLVTKSESKNVFFLGCMSNQEVLNKMQSANIFVFPSNHCEGWGAVLNEAMACGCACITSDAIGSVPYLIKDGKNGLIFKNGSCKNLVNKLLKLCKHNDLRINLASNGYDTIYEEWNAEIAGKRLSKVFNNIILGKNIDIYKEGLCSIQK